FSPHDWAAGSRFSLTRNSYRDRLGAMQPHRLKPIFWTRPSFDHFAVLLSVITLAQGGDLRGAVDAPGSDDLAAFVRVSPRDARYFELSNGHGYVPIGLNMIAPDGA